MTQPPSRLSADLLAVQKGAAAPAEVAPVAPPPAAPASVAASHPAMPPPAPVLPAPTATPAASRLDLVRRAPPAEIKRSSFSTRLPDDMQEWLRVKAFVERRGVQEVVEEAIAFYRLHVQRGGEG